MNDKCDNVYGVANLFNLFCSLKDKYFLFVEPGGNCGDYLIYKGAEKIANLCGLQFKSVSIQEFLHCSYPIESVVYIHGSGGFVPWWSGTPILALKKALSDYGGLLLSGHQHFISITII